MISKAELAQLIDAYADAKSTNNQILVKKMIEELQIALNSIYSAEEDTPEDTQAESVGLTDSLIDDV